MSESPLVGSGGADERIRGDRNNLAIGVSIAILGVMAVAIAIDFSSMPSMALVTIVVIGGLIAALIAWG
jgi:protein-S-isoprenylcysteine O-methyltransferase Ste14